MGKGIEKAYEDLKAAENLSKVIGGREAARQVEDARQAVKAAAKGGKR